MDSQAYNSRPATKRNLTSPDNPFAAGGRSITAHKPPRYDIYGQPSTSKDIVTTSKIPPSWEGVSKTRSKLLEDRRASIIPHISYDLDGDGIVGGQDLVLAKMFDKDKDGRLNTTERANAEEALKKNFDENFVWGVDKGGIHRPYRLLQKRGQIIDADDFQPITETYPEFPKGQPKVQTLSELRAVREADRRQHVESKNKKWEDEHPRILTEDLAPSEWHNPNPKFTSITQKQEADRIQQRLAAGLGANTDIKQPIGITT